MNVPRISIITVNYNGLRFMQAFFSSLSSVEQGGMDVEIILVDNGSADDSLTLIREWFPYVRVIENDANNYTRAINIGIAVAKGDFVVLVNNDVTFHQDWLMGLCQHIQADERIGAVQSKILFSDGVTINSVGVEEVCDSSFKDIGLHEKDVGQYGKACELEFFSGGSVMFRRECLDAVGLWDEDFIMYCEDMDYSYRCRQAGWKLFYAPTSIIYHQFHGTASVALCEYLSVRNRFFYLVKYFPDKFPASITNSALYLRKKYDLLYRAALQATLKLFASHNEDRVRAVLPSLQESLMETLGAVSTHSLFSQLEVMLGTRKIRLGMYDQAMYFPGGGQRYLAEMAALVQDRYEVTLITNRSVDLARYNEWYGLDLSQCKVKVVTIPFFERQQSDIVNEGLAVMEENNVFDVVAQESLSYDLFVNGNMLSKVNPLSPVSAFICHFPDRKRETYFQVDKYDFIVTNSEYTSFWLKERWGIAATHRIYPPINMENPASAPASKEKMILTVSRFEVSGSKKQFELVRAFADINRSYPEALAGWRFVLAGGSIANNHYLELVKDAVREAGCTIEIFPNATAAEIGDLYRRAAIFWHACGLEETLPEKVEHFGMTTVEAMQNYCVPIVIDGGGQREIVEHGESGFRFSTIGDLQVFTMQVMQDENLRSVLAVRAKEQSRRFEYKVFKGGVEKLFSDMETALLGQDVLGHPSISKA